MALAKFTLREIRNRPGRAVLTLLSVVIGVAMIVSVSVATSTTRKAQQEMLAAAHGESPMEVMSEAGASFNATVLPEIEKIAGVETAVPVIRQYAVMFYGDHKQVKTFALGVDPVKDAAVRKPQIVAGRWLTPNDNGLVIDRGLAEPLKLSVGDKVKLLTSSGQIGFKIVGIVSQRDAGAGQSMIYLSLPAAQEYMRSPGEIDSVQIVAHAAVSLDRLHQDLIASVPQRLVVVRAAENRSQAEETLLSTELGVLLASIFSWAVALLIVLNTFQMNVVERRRQLAVLRAIGATRRQVIWLVCREALAMGLLGTVLGVLLGLGGAHLLSLATATVLEMTLPSLQISWQPLALAIVVGPAIAALGAFLPAWQAGRLTPLEGMGAVQRSDLEPPPWSFAVIGLVIVGAGSALLAASMANHLPMTVAVVAALSVPVGMIFLLPVSLSPLARATNVALGWLCGVEGRLAQGQVVRRRGRTTLTIGVLFLAITLSICLGNTIVDSVRDVQRWGRLASQGDFFVRALMPDMNTGLAGEMPEQVAQEIKDLNGIASIQTVRFASVKVNDKNVIILAGNFGDQVKEQFKFDLTSGNPDGVPEALARGEVLIGTVLSLREKLKVGDEVPLKSAKFRVAGTVNDYLAGGLTMYMDKKIAKRRLGIDGVDAYVLWAKPGQQASVEQALVALTKERGLLLQTREEVLGLIDSRMNGVVACLWSLLVVVFIVASLGVVNTLTMNVIEQTRELGLLRIVAMTRRQVRKMILAQAAILALIGLVPGALAGLGVAYVLNRSMAPLLGHPIAFVIHTSMIVGCFLIAFAIVLIAAWFPATRAARLKLAEAIQYH